jgi:hypothetical protein
MARRRFPEIVIEADGTVDIGLGNVQRAGEHRNRSFVDISEILLKRMQNREQRSRNLRELFDCEACSFRVPNLRGGLHTNTGHAHHSTAQICHLFHM